MEKHSHHHDHDHHHHVDVSGTKLLVVTVLNLSISIVQIIGGILSNSLSLLSDAFHNLGDSSALFIAFFANKISKKEPNFRNTFGYKRVEILAALFNSIVLIVICSFLLYESYKRFISPETIEGKTMLAIAIFGLLANFISMLILQKGKDSNINIKAAYLHLLGDTMSSVAVIVGGILIWKYEIYWIDAVISGLVSLYIIYHTFKIVKEAVDILMQSTPSNLDIEDIKEHIEEIAEIDNVHHIHIWKLNDSQIHFEAHINLKNNILVSETESIRHQIEDLLEDHFDIEHITLQLGYNCCDGNTKLIV